CALKALLLLGAEAQVRAIYCEQIEDLLVERTDGCFCGIQIKTRELDQSPLKASDEIVVAALARFCVKDTRFPGHFASFVFVTNFVFYHGDSGDDVSNVLRCARENPNLDGVGKRSALWKNVHKVVERSGLPLEAVVRTLRCRRYRRAQPQADPREQRNNESRLCPAATDARDRSVAVGKQRG